MKCGSLLLEAFFKLLQPLLQRADLRAEIFVLRRSQKMPLPDAFRQRQTGRELLQIEILELRHLALLGRCHERLPALAADHLDADAVAGVTISDRLAQIAI